MSDIEKLNSVKFNIRKALESQGSDITADTPFEEYPKYVMGLSGGSGGGSGSGGGLYIEYAKGSPTLNLTYKQVANAITGGNSVKLGVAAEGQVGTTLLYSCVGFMSRTGNYMAIFAGIFGNEAGRKLLGDVLIFSASSEDDYLAPTE